MTAFQRQFQGQAKQGADCGVIGVIHALRFATDDRIKPSPVAVRKAMGAVSGPGDATNTLDQQQAYDSYRDDARRKKLKLPAYGRRLMAPWEEVIEALDAGKGVVLQASYEVINKRRPDLSGDPAFMGAHTLFLGRIRREGSRVSIKVWDGLLDGRRPGMSRGPQWYPGWLLRLAAETFVADGLTKDLPPAKAKEKAEGRATFGVITKATRIVPKPEPPPEPVPEPGPDDLAVALEALALCHDANASFRETVDDMETHAELLTQALGVARTALVSNTDAAMAAIADIEELLGPRPPDTGEPVVSGAGAER